MVEYQLAPADLHAHLYRVGVRLARPSSATLDFSLPVWIPGSYLVREFARHLSGLEARQGGRRLAVEPLDKASWRVACEAGGEAVELCYRVYAFDPSVRAAFLDAERGFFNGTSVFVRLHGHEAGPQRLRLVDLPEGWQAATAMRGSREAGYEAADYDELVDHPFALGTFWRGGFEAGGVPHEFVVQGAWPSFDGERLLADARRVCEAHIAFWETVPFERYLFLLHATDDGYGGLEHRASTALIAARHDLPRREATTAASDGYAGLLGLVSHEYFHAWNVKRLKPAEFAGLDYTRENYTRLLWFFEGFTSYYDDLLLRRAGLLDAARYLKQLAKAINGIATTPGRGVQSVAEASFDAWVKFYRADENTPNATVNYYAKGSLVALCFDLTLRAAGSSLDAAMRDLWRSSGGGPVGEAELRAALERAAGRSLEAEFAAWVHGREELPLAALLARAGVRWGEEPAGLAQTLGLKVSESALTGVQVRHVMRGGAGERAGLAAGDELIAVDGWRLRRLDDASALAAAPDRPLDVLVARDQRLLGLRLDPQGAPSGPPTVVLTLAPEPDEAALALRRAWLGDG